MSDTLDWIKRNLRAVKQAEGETNKERGKQRVNFKDVKNIHIRKEKKDYNRFQKNNGNAMNKGLYEQ